MDDLLREFVGETLDMMDAVAGDLVKWEADPADRSGLDGIFRTVHTVKGSSGFFDIPRISAIAHAAEELLDALRSRKGAPTRASVAMVLAAFDRIRELTQAIAASGAEPTGDDTKLIGALLADLRTVDRTAVAPEDLAEGVASSGEILSEVDVSSEAHGDLPAAWRSVRVPVDLLDELMSGVSDLVLARNEVAAQLRARGLDLIDIAAFDRLSQLLVSVRSTVSNMRMVPLRHLYAPLPRLVRQVADELGKDIQLTLTGSEVEIDREVVEALRDPMLHVLRNAVDHGMESAETRRARGKAAQGRITVAARQAGNRILINITDDGAGLALDALVKRALTAGRITAADASQMSDARKAELVFLPGLSTADTVTGISGRGVGMDVVKANVERLGGTIRIMSREGEGVSLTLDVPMTLTIIAALAIDVGGQSFAIPRSAIDEVMLASSDTVKRQQAGSFGLVRIRDKVLPLVTIEHVLGLALSSDQDDADRAIVVCRMGQGGSFALEVPDVRDHEELVIKPLPPVLLSAGIYSGLSLPDNGQPMLVFDVEGIARQQLGDIASIAADIEPQVEETSDSPKTSWLCFDDGHSGRHKAVVMATVERICDVASTDIFNSGGRRLARIDQEMIALVDMPDQWQPAPMQRLIKLSDGYRQVMLPVGRIGEMIDIEPEMIPAEPESGLLGMALVEGELTELVDTYCLLARHGSAASARSIPSTVQQDAGGLKAEGDSLIWIVDPAGGEWAAGFLVPTLTSAGYRVALVSEREAVQPHQGGGDGPTVISLNKSGPVAPLTLESRGRAHRLSAYDRGELLRLISLQELASEAVPPRKSKRKLA